MSKSPTHESTDCSCYELDPEVNFSQFLEEERQHARKLNLQRGRQVWELRKRARNHGANSLFAWCKIDRKIKPSSDPVHVPDISKPTKHYGSGLLCRIEPPRESKHCRLSGLVSILFTPKRTMENAVPYMSLDQPNNPQHMSTYRPVYLVT